jgi:hypothetical protein
MRKFLIIILVIIAVLGTGAFLVWRWAHVRGGLKSAVVQTVAQQLVSNPEESSVVPKVLGFEKPQTYLVLFLNNTEIRPGGGFIGAYSVVRFDQGVPEILKVEGTEILDNLAAQDFPSVPPEPLQKYLPIKRWGFRDSNWSPDFVISSLKSLDLFKKEKGVAADEITGVIGITPTLLEEILKISGPIMVNGEEFNADNFTEKLEYEVEFGFAENGLDFDQRKKILTDLSHAFLAKIKGDIFKHWSQYLALSEKMFSEKHILAYSANPDMEKILLARGWGGVMKESKDDYVLWVDANLASLKTDKVIDRELSYSFAPTNTDAYVGTVKMKYINKGSFTKFTTRYRTYARVYVPLGSKFISVSGSMKEERSLETGIVDQGIENGRQWFGTFISIEPGKTGELAWQFYLSPTVAASIKNNAYSLLVQKQLGTLAHRLTLDLNFGKNISSATPGEEQQHIGDQKYTYQTDLTVDRDFYLQFAN